MYTSTYGSICTYVHAYMGVCITAVQYTISIYTCYDGILKHKYNFGVTGINYTIEIGGQLIFFITLMCHAQLYQSDLS